ncbi:MAG: fumarylacetoacetate hydrolase family protein [Mycetocola sp.]
MERDAVAAATALRTAQRERVACSPIREGRELSLDDAYEIQEHNVALFESADNPRVGRKVGLTSAAVQRQLGVDRPDFGVLLADMDITGTAVIAAGRLLQPRVEAEVAFILGRDITDAHPDAVSDAVAWVAPALEIVDSRIADWKISIIDTVADNASSGLFVLGPERRTLAELDPQAVAMTMRRNDEQELVSEGSGTDCLGSPLNALVWVAETAIRLNRPLRAGEIVLSGALGPMVAVAPGDSFIATITGLGTVSVRAATNGESA